MASTVIRGAQIKDSTVQRHDLDTSTVGQAVVTKIVQGSGITLSSTGADSGTGDVTVNSPDTVSTDAGNIAVLGSDSHILVPQSQITLMRLRSINIVGNSTFEVDQRNGGLGQSNIANSVFVLDRWLNVKTAPTIAYQGTQATNQVVLLPGTNFRISQNAIAAILQTQQVTLAAGDAAFFEQSIEGPLLRELINDASSLQVVAQTNVAGGLKFSLAIRDPGAAHSYVVLCTLTASNVWQTIPFPNIPVFPSAGNWSLAPGAQGYRLDIVFAAGSNFITPANSTWQNGNFIGAVGMDNLGSKPVGSNLVVGFIQHEPGTTCTTPIDCSFGQNLDGDFGCQRYFSKSYDYVTKPGTVASNGAINLYVVANGQAYLYIPYKKTMAKVPTLTGYSISTGAVNTVRDVTAGVDRTISNAFGAGDSGFGGFALSTVNAALSQYQFQYVAETGL